MVRLREVIRSCGQNLSGNRGTMLRCQQGLISRF
ncbi:Uncharacterised protein [Vibrio cholerae]|nr:Uncharacterised protein [Vibrio cholerae]